MSGASRNGVPVALNRRSPHMKIAVDLSYGPRIPKAKGNGCFPRVYFPDQISDLVLSKWPQCIYHLLLWCMYHGNLQVMRIEREGGNGMVSWPFFVIFFLSKDIFINLPMVKRQETFSAILRSRHKRVQNTKISQYFTKFTCIEQF